MNLIEPKQLLNVMGSTLAPAEGRRSNWSVVNQVEVAPCDSKGKEYTEADDKFVDTPGDSSMLNQHSVLFV